jgi:uncharacterized protein YdaU (DUF1376 family)
VPDDRIKRPAYQWYVGDARNDEVFMLMSYEQQGIYRALLDHQWIEGSIPRDVELVAGLLPKITLERFAQVWPLISTKFQPHGTDRLINARLEGQRRELEDYIAEQRKRGAEGGRRKADRLALARLRPEQVLQPTLQPEAKPKASSSSSTSSLPIAKEQQSGAADKPPTPAKEFLSWFQREYKTRRDGATYFVTWDKHMPIVGRLLKLHAPDRLRKHATILLTTDDPWTETTDRGIEVLASKINWLDERLCRWEKERKAREAV